MVLATSIISLESVLATLPLQRLKRSTLIVDVLSVKVGPSLLLIDVESVASCRQRPFFVARTVLDE